MASITGYPLKFKGILYIDGCEKIVSPSGSRNCKTAETRSHPGIPAGGNGRTGDGEVLQNSPGTKGARRGVRGEEVEKWRDDEAEKHAFVEIAGRENVD